MILFDWTWLGHDFGVGVAWDWTLITHALFFGALVPIAAFTYGFLYGYAYWEMGMWRRWVWLRRAGLLVSLTAALVVEVGQMWQFHWKIAVTGEPAGMFGLGDLAAGGFAALLVYWLLRRI